MREWGGKNVINRKVFLSLGRVLRPRGRGWGWESGWGTEGSLGFLSISGVCLPKLKLWAGGCEPGKLG